MAIPTIPGTARVQDQSIGVQRNPQPRIQALGAFKQAVGSANNAVQGMAGDVMDYEEKKRKAEEAYAFNSSSLSFQKLHSEYLHGVKKMPDEQIVPTWSETTATWKQQQLDTYGGKLSPRAKKVFEMNLNNAIGESTAKFQVVADKLGSQRRLGAARANKDEFLKTGDPAMKSKAISALQIAVNAGDMTKDDMHYEVSKMDEQLEHNQILNGIDSDPYATLKAIDAGKFKDVPETELATLRNTAEKQVNFVQRTTGMDLTNDFAMTHVPKTDAELQDLKKSGKLTGEYIESYGKMVALQGHKNDVDKQAIFLNRLRDLDLTESSNPEKDVREITDEAASLSPQLQKDIHTLADQKLKAAKKGEPAELPIHKTQLEMMKSTFDERQSMSKLSKSDFRAKYGHKIDQPDEETERLRYAKAQKDYIDWSHTKKGNEATPEQAAAERERLGFGAYKSAMDVKAAVKAGKVSRDLAKEILANQFGIK